MVETLRWRVTSDTKATHRFNARSVQFDDGYEQRQLKSLCPKLRNWDVKVVSQKASVGEIRTFFDARGSVEPFNWRPPEGGMALVKMFEYTETSKDGKVCELGCTFEEVLT